MNSEVTAYIESAEEKNRQVLNSLRELIFSIAPQANEQFKWSRPVYAMSKDFCYLKSSKKDVTLGFFEFEKIQINSHLIEGTGKSMRHVKLKNVEQIAQFQVAKMIKEVLE